MRSSRATVLFLALAAAGLHAQAPATQPPAPIVRQAPLPAAPSTLGRWPDDLVLRRGTVLLVQTFGTEHPRECSLARIDAHLLYCSAGGRLQAVYDRGEVERIDRRPKANAALEITEGGMLGVGAGSLGLSLLCGVDGGPLCRTPAITGLALLAGGGVLHILRHEREIHARHDRKNALYIEGEGTSATGSTP